MRYQVLGLHDYTFWVDQAQSMEKKLHTFGSIFGMGSSISADDDSF